MARISVVAPKARATVPVGVRTNRAVSGGVGRVVRFVIAWLPRGQSLSEDVWRVRHRTLLYLLRAHVVGVFCFGVIVGRDVVTSAEAAGLLGVFALLAGTDPRRRRFVSSVAALGLVSASAVLVSLSGGVIEMHFHFFVMVGILTLYQDWLPFLLAIGFVVVHHGVFGTLDAAAVYDHADAVAHPVKWALIHGAFVLAASTVSVIAWRLNEDQAFRDSLTRLPNRALFHDRVGHAMARAGRRPEALAVLFVDLDGFKGVNDTLGHGAGDNLLCAVAERLRACVRPADTVARLGGDEFAILLEDLSSRDEATRVARRILDAVASPFSIAGRETSVTASIGIAFNVVPNTVDELLRNADVAMYVVKDSGRGRYKTFAEEMHTAVVNRVELAQELRVACEEEQFVVHYQPVVSLSSGEVVSLEALVRWQHPRRGLLLPGDFIEDAVETRSIVPLGAWVLRNACTQAKAWHDRFPDRQLTVSVNLSPVQVVQRNVVDVVREALDDSGLAPEFLVIELTEEVMIKDADVAATRLGQIKDLGVHLAIDDFGTGYSSLNYLRRLPVDILKIDKSFVDGLTAGPSESAFGKLIIDFAHTLGLRIIAEGVEHAEQAEVLRHLGCQEAQGFLFARPTPANAIEQMLNAGGNEPLWAARPGSPRAEVRG